MCRGREYFLAALAVLCVVPYTAGLFVCPSPCICNEETEGPEGDVITHGSSLVVDCRKQGLAQIPPLDGLQGTPIFRLYLDRNQITQVPGHAFQKLHVEGIQLSDNPIGNVSAEAFSGIRGLKYLSLRRTQLITEPHVFTSKIVEVEALDLSEIKTGIFTNIKSAVFGELPRLEQLLLKQNGINSIDSNAFIGLPQVFELRLEDNKLKAIPEAILTLTALKFLHLDNNPISSIEGKPFKSFSNLETLTLSDSRLPNSSFIDPNAFEGITDSLKALTLSLNNLLSVPCTLMSRLTNLEILKISDAMISEISPGCLENLGKLKVLDLSGNMFKVVADVFTGIENNLETLLLARLDLNVNNLPLIPFDKMHNLNQLDLSGNAFPSVKEDVFKVISVRHLSLRYCQIVKVDANAFQGLRAPAVLDLNNNKVKNMTFLENKCQFERVELFRNPVTCDCSFYHVVRYDITTFVGRCAAPTEYSDIELDDFKSNSDVRRECGTLSGVNDEIVCFWQLPQTSEDTSSSATSKLLAHSSFILIVIHSFLRV